MTAPQPIPPLYHGQTGDYFGSDYEGLPATVHPSVQEVGQQLAERVVYLGRLTCSLFASIQVYTYVTVDQRIAISVMATELGLQGIDCMCKFADGSFLTTTTVQVLHGAYDEQRLFRVSLPGLSVLELLEQHCAYVQAFEARCGEAQPIFEDLGAIARMVDEYTLRQEANVGHGFLQFASGFAQANLAQMMGNEMDDEDDDELLEDGEKLGDAALLGKLTKVQQLLTEGADPNVITECGKTPLMLAAMYGHKAVIEALLDAGADPNLGGVEEFEEGQTALMSIASSFFATNRAEVIQFLVSRGANVNAQDDKGQTALMMAGENTDAVKALIEAGADVNVRDREGNTALMMGSWAVQQLLKQAGASEEGLNNVALVEAAGQGNLSKVEDLLQAGANVNYADGSALVAAAGKGNLALVDRLIEAGADVNLGWKTGFTAIAEAAYRGHFAIVERLLAAGADPFQRTHDGEFDNALEAAQRGKAEGHYKGNHDAIIERLRQQS